MARDSVDWLGIASISISLLSAAFTVVIGLRGNKTQERVATIEVGRDEREGKAALQAYFVLGRFWRQDDILIIYLENIGNGAAHKPRFTVDGMVFTRYPTFKKTSLKSMYVQPLQPNEQIEFTFDFKSYLPKPHDFGVLWLDEVGVQHFQSLPILRQSSDEKEK